jgi:hypothetical protein
MMLEPHLLLAAVREVSKLANPATPAEASQRAFDNARPRSSRFHDLPAARNIAATLKLPWREVLEVAHEPDDRHNHLLSVRTYNARRPWLTHEYIGFVLKFAAQRLELRSVSPSQYRVERERMLRADRAGWLHGRQLRLPNTDQIDAAAGGWDTALALAGLAARAGLAQRSNGQPRTPAATPLELLERFYAIHGTQPSAAGLRVFAQANGIPYSQNRARRWNESVADWKAKRRARGLRVPDGPPPRGEHPDYTRDVGAALPGEQPRSKWDVEDCIAHVVMYLEQLRPGQRSTARGYTDWVKGRNGCPACSTFDQYGGWASVRRLALERLNQTRG